MENIKIKYTVILKDKNGKTILRKTFKSRSLLANFLRWLWCFIDSSTSTAASSLTITDTGGVGRAFPSTGTRYIYNFGAFKAAATDDAYGIQVGSGSNTVSPNDYMLQQKISQGTGSGQLVYGAQTNESIVISGNTASVRISRTFTNNSGSIIQVREIGLAVGAYESGGTQRYILILRDVLPSALSVPDGQTLTVRYTIAVEA